MRYAHANVEINGAKLREIRKEAGLNIVQLSARVGVSFSYLAAIERGERPTVAPARFITICDALGLEDRTVLHASKAGAAA
ncbi:helix-turn-helix domain-containing protein [Verrucosispora sp. TAA-831]|uniref:helix-turn-helix domain-containing protein n=1 Tax=Verrucosispora sp. TAA-831 TaxID=3422227 RepID=UPI003D6DC06D